MLVSNRLPVTIKRYEDGTYNFSMSSGGLVTGLSGLSKSTSFQWYGWPGLEIPSAESKNLSDRLLSEYDAVPVFMDDKLADEHYNGFSSEVRPRCRINAVLMGNADSILWPLLHYHPGEMFFDESAW